MLLANYWLIPNYQDVNKVKKKTYDIAIIGGGIHGAGVAQAAAAAGYSVICLEQNDIGSGTSSRSSKLIHGGLRYLETGQFSLVKECLKDRNSLLELAPNLVKLVPFYIPVYKNSKRSSLTIRAGLMLYALLGKLGTRFMFSRFSVKDWDNPDLLIEKNLVSVFQYWDAQTDDRALTRSVMHSAKNLGAIILNFSQFTSASLENDVCTIKFITDHQELSIESRIIINAAGSWANQVLNKITPQPDITPIELVQGTHILIDRVQTEGIYYMESPTDNRAVFSMPWKNKTLVGTTEKKFEGDPENVTPSDQEVDYLIAIYNNYFPSRKINRQDVIESFAGLRVLLKSERSVFSRSRDTYFATYPVQQPKVLSIYGGKLTAYQTTADKVIKIINQALPKRKKVANPRKIRLQPLNSEFV